MDGLEHECEPHLGDGGFAVHVLNYRNYLTLPGSGTRNLY